MPAINDIITLPTETTPRISRESLKAGWENLKADGFFAGYNSYEAWEKTNSPAPKVNDQPLKPLLDKKAAQLEAQKQIFWEATGGEGEHKLDE